MQPIRTLTISAVDLDSRSAVTPADILRGAARYLEIRGWYQISFYGEGNETFPPACVTGAIGMAAHGGVVLVPLTDGLKDGLRDCQRANEYLQTYLTDTGEIDPSDDEWSSAPKDTFEWNDGYGQTAENVIATLRAAADEWHRQHTPTDGDRS